MKTSLPAHPETCPRCLVGRIQRKRIPYATVIEGQLLTIRRFPAWVCDICHAYIYDPAAMSHLEASLSARQQPKKASRTRQSAPTPPPSADKPLESY
ncbi:MAG: YgiT-type zinc finger protein [Chloroflexi bacterium]|nr:YgiT-type zinc finger protein [Chloroflexota bacterium]